MNSFDSKSKPEEPWNRCVPGTLKREKSSKSFDVRRRLLIGTLQGGALTLIATPFLGLAYMTYKATRTQELSCRECRDKLRDYALNQVSQRERRSIDAHLAVCPSCQSKLDELTA